MKIVRETPDELLLVDRGRSSRIIFGGIALIAALLVRYADHLPFQVHFFPSNGVFIGCCAALAVLARDRKIRFDRVAGEVTFDWPGFSFPRRTRTIPLSSIERVELQAGPGSKSALPCRVRLILTGGEVVSLTECSMIINLKVNDALVRSIRDWLAEKGA